MLIPQLKDIVFMYKHQIEMKEVMEEVKITGYNMHSKIFVYPDTSRLKLGQKMHYIKNFYTLYIPDREILFDTTNVFIIPAETTYNNETNKHGITVTHVDAHFIVFTPSRSGKIPVYVMKT